MTRRCESCGRFVPKHHLATAFHHYDIDPTLPVAVYSIATATKFKIRLDCRGCSMTDALMTEHERGHGLAVGREIQGGWERCDPSTKQTNYAREA